MTLVLEPYLAQRDLWPQSGRHILAPRRAIQLELRGAVLAEYAADAIVELIDVTVSGAGSEPSRRRFR